MSAYTLHIIHNGQTHSIPLNAQQPLRLTAQENTLYQLTDNQGNLLVNTQFSLQGEDAIIYLPEHTEALLILEDYLQYSPVLQHEALVRLNSILATNGAQEALPLLASQVATANAMGSALVIGTGALSLATLVTISEDAEPSAARLTTTNATNNTSATNTQNPNNNGTSASQPSDTNNTQNPNDNNTSASQPSDTTNTQNPNNNSTSASQPSDTTNTQNPNDNGTSASQPNDTNNTQNPNDNGTNTPPSQPSAPFNIQINPIVPNGMINAADSQLNYVISGTYSADSALQGLAVHVQIGHTILPATLSGNTWSVSIAGSVLASAQGQQTLTATLSAQDAQGNSLSAHSSDTYQVDTQITTPIIQFDVLADDDIINLLESQSLIRLSGTVQHATDNDTIKIIIGGVAHEIALQDGKFSLMVEGDTLKNHPNIQATITTTDSAGNQASASADKAYAVDITAPTPSITLNPITGDNIIDYRDSQYTSITGAISQIDSADTNQIILRCICSTCATGTEKLLNATLNADGTFSADIATNELQIYDTIYAEIQSADSAGNTAKASDAQQYRVELPSIQLFPIADDNFINAAEFNYGRDVANIGIKGMVSQVDTANASVTLQFYKAGVLIKETPVSLDGAGNFSTALSGKELHNNYDSITAILSTAMGEFSDTQHYKAAAFSPRWEQLALTQVSDDNLISASDTSQETTIIRGNYATFINPNTAEGMHNHIDLTLKINDKHYSQTHIGEDGEFSFVVQTTELLADSDKKIELIASLTDDAGNTAGNRSAELSYQVLDNHINTPTLSIHPIANINADYAATHANTTLTGDIITDGDVSIDNTLITLNINGTSYQATRVDNTWTLTIPTTELIQAGGAISASVTATDYMGNQASANSSAHYLVDIEAPKLSIQLDPIADDNHISPSEWAALGDSITITGKVTGEYQPQDKVNLSVANQTVALSILSDGSFSYTLDKTNFEQGNSISANISSTDALGNSSSVSAKQTYSIQKQDIVITLDPITSDNLLNVSEQFATILITGSLSGADIAQADSVQLTLNGNTYTAAITSDQRFSLNINGSELAQQANYRISAQVRDAQGAIQASTSKAYQVDANVAAAIHIENVDDNALSVAQRYQSLRLSGKLALGDSIFAQGYNMDAIKALVLTIGEQSFTIGFDRDDYSFHLDLSAEEAAALAGKEITHHFLTSNSNIYYLTGTDSNKIVRSINAKTSDISKTEQDKITLIFDDNHASTTLNGKHILNDIEQNSQISGSVSGTASAGDMVEITLNGNTYQTKVDNTQHFNLNVQTKDLSAHQGDIIATLNTHDLAGNAIAVSDSASISRTIDSSADFVNKHSAANITRNTTHTDDGYNFSYMIDALRSNSGNASGFMNFSITPFGGFTTSGAPATIKYYFANIEKDYSQGWEYRNANYVKAGSFADFGDATIGVKAVLDKFAALTNLQFVEVDSREQISGDGIIFMRAQLAGVMASSGAFAFEGGNVVFNTSSFGQNANLGDYANYLIIHELMHTFGTRHTDGYFTRLGYASSEDYSTEFSTMSYSYSYHTANNYRDFGIYDILYLHYRYGLNASINAGNDIYSFGNYASLTQDGAIYIADANGIDSFDASHETEGVVVNLTPGSWIYLASQKSDSFIIDSSTTINAGDSQKYFAEQDLSTLSLTGSTGKHTHIDYVKGQGFIGYGTQIENLNGSAFADILIGNNADNNISGNAGDDQIEGGNGHDYLDGGTGADIMLGGSGDDHYVIDNLADKAIESASQGFDTVYSHIDYHMENHIEAVQLLGSDNLNATGNDSNNHLIGNSGANQLNGGIGNDELTGGRGADILIGGEGDDKFIFNSILDGSIDIIQDFNLANDIIVLSKAIFNALDSSLQNASTHLLYNSDNGVLSYDPDGSGITDAIQFAQLSSGLDANLIRYEII